jgi:hypothetical protein
VIYGFGVLETALRFRLARAGLKSWPLLGDDAACAASDGFS